MEFLSRIASGPSQVILSLAVMLFGGFGMTRITKRLHLPDVTGYILAGILLGPYVLNLVPAAVTQGMEFVTDIALAYIAFGVGKYFKLSLLRASARRIFVITLAEALLAAAAVALTMIFVFRLPVPFALLLGAIGSATAPASTIMTIRQYHAKGEFVDTLLQVAALDDAVSLVAFSVCAAVAGGLAGGGPALDWKTLALPLAANAAALALGAGCGALLKRIITDGRSKDHRLILVNAVIFALAGVCDLLDVSPLLACMMMGAVYVNLIDNKQLFKQVNHFSPPILLLFFVLSGMRLDLGMLRTAGLIGIGYFFVRIAGKYLGAWLGARVTGASKGVRRLLGLALVPQAGVAIGLAALGQRILPAESGAMLAAINLSSSVLYEMIGPACAKGALRLVGAIEPGKPPEAPAQEETAGDGPETTGQESRETDPEENENR